MSETVLTDISVGISPDLPITVEIVNGAVYLDGFDDRLGNLDSAFLTFRYDALVQALILDFFGTFGIGNIESQLAVEFSPGTAAPDFASTLVASAGAGIGSFIGPFGSGLPFTFYSGFSTVVPIEDISGLADTPEFEVLLGATGLNSPTFNGVPTVASTPVNYFNAIATMHYVYSAFQHSSGADTVRGDTGNNFHNLGAGNDWFDGGDGDDTVIGGAGADRLKGGDGSDTADYSVATSGVTVYLKYTGRDVGGGQGADRLSDIENLTGSDFADRLIGDDLANIMSGGAGSDVIKTFEGDDTGDGGDGADKILLGEGNDTGRGGAGNDIVSGFAGEDTVNGDEGNDFLYGGRGNDELNGGDGDDRMRGNLNNDTMNGDAGNDIMRGGGGNDTMNGGAGEDWIAGGNGSDRIIGGAGDDVLIGSTSAAVGDGVEDVFVFENIDGDGIAGNDRVKGFENGIDKIDITEFFTYTFEDLLNYVTETTFGIEIRSDEDSILIEGLTMSEFDASDIIFP